MLLYRQWSFCEGRGHLFQATLRWVLSPSSAVNALQADTEVKNRCKGFQSKPHSSVNMHAGTVGGTDHYLEGLQAPHDFLPQASQACPIVSRADQGVRQRHEILLSNMDTALSSNIPAPGTLAGLQPTFDTRVSH